jgi:hypothetical protein
MPDDDEADVNPEPEPAATMPDLSSLGITAEETGPFLAHIIGKHFAREAAEFREALNVKANAG